MQTNVKAVELRDLWKRYKTSGDQKARDRLVVAYSPLVKYVAGRMGAGLPAHVDEADLISYGLGGLISAIERFDLTREIRFETYAITRIKGAILDELRALDWVPRSVRARARQIERADAQARGAPAARPDRGGAGGRARADDRGVPRRAAADRELVDLARSTSCGARPTPAATASR